jgi:hypothetical protein
VTHSDREFWLFLSFVNSKKGESTMKRLLAPLLAVLLGASAFGQAGHVAVHHAPIEKGPKGFAKPHAVTVSQPGKPDFKFMVVDREQLRIKDAKKAKALDAQTAKKLNLPVTPTVVDWTQGGKVPLPILGNDTYGDCYPAAACHLFTVITAAVAQDPSLGVTFSQAALIAWYLQVSGGDNGTSDSDIFPAIKAGFIPPNGANKVLDVLVVDPTNPQLRKDMMFRFGPPLYTCCLRTTWEANPNAGATWTNDGQLDPQAGHAMLLDKQNANNDVGSEMWGLNPEVTITDAGLQSSDPEIAFTFSMQWFNKSGYTPSGIYYSDAVAAWKAAGGDTSQFPANPFPAPNPNPPTPPTPVVTGSGFTFDSSAKVLNVTDSTIQIQANGVPVTPAPAPTGPITVKGPNGDTITLPTGWTVQTVSKPTPDAGAAANWLVIVFDSFAIEQAVVAGNQTAIETALQKLIADLQLPATEAAKLKAVIFEYAKSKQPKQPPPIVPPKTTSIDRIEKMLAAVEGEQNTTSAALEKQIATIEGKLNRVTKQPVWVNIRCAADAEVVINGEVQTEKGVLRHFKTDLLDHGKSYELDVHITRPNGFYKHKSIPMSPGQVINIES